MIISLSGHLITIQPQDKQQNMKGEGRKNIATADGDIMTASIEGPDTADHYQRLVICFIRRKHGQS
jgi:hypothetical protein